MQADLDILLPLQSSLEAENEALRSKADTLCDQNDALQDDKTKLEEERSNLQKRLETALADVGFFFSM
jgi:FtsZ-binding cell division protein ZapB